MRVSNRVPVQYEKHLLPWCCVGGLGGRGESLLSDQALLKISGSIAS